MVKSSHGLHILRCFRVRAEGGAFGPRILLHHGRRPVKGGLRLRLMSPSYVSVLRPAPLPREILRFRSRDGLGNGAPRAFTQPVTRAKAEYLARQGSRA